MSATLDSSSTSIELPYLEDSTVLFEKIRHLHWPIFLDSTGSSHPQARYDILAAQPDTKIITTGPTTTVERRQIDVESGKYEFVRESSEKPTAVLETEFSLWKKQLTKAQSLTGLQHDILPGLFGYFGYELGKRFEQIIASAERDIDLPDLACGLYSWIIVVDHQSKHSTLINFSNTVENNWLLKLVNKKSSRPTPTSTNKFELNEQWQSNLDPQDYKAAFEKTINYIQQGDTYQVNLTHRLSNKYTGDPWLVYKKLRQDNKNPFACFFDLNDHQILSLSPEQFIQIKDNNAQTRPIKGTIARGDTPTADIQLAEQLSRSEKNRAENLMIVDLLRNDFSKSCIPHSVKVPALFDLESFPTVHHLVSTVVGELAQDKSPLQLFESCFPGGSITGTPKIRAMEIIGEIEPHQRSIYCGSILYLDIAGRLDSNITIRTLLCHEGSIYCWAGGGIVADSECDAEYQETFDKIKGLLSSLSKFLV